MERGENKKEKNKYENITKLVIVSKRNGINLKKEYERWMFKEKMMKK